MSGTTCVICDDEIDEVRVRNASDEPVHSDCLTDALEELADQLGIKSGESE